MLFRKKIDRSCDYCQNGAKLDNGKLVTSGGRVTGTTAVADSLADAVKEAYRLADGVRFEKAYRRSDIGQRGLAAYQ